MADWSYFLDITESCVTRIKQCYEEDRSEEEKEDSLELIELVLQYGVLLKHTDIGSGRDQILVSIVESIRQLAISIMRERDDASVTSTRRGGSLCFNITEERLATFLLDANFTKHGIAILLRCSSKTISRRLQEFNIILQTTQVADDDLDKVTLLYVQRYPNAGQKNYGAFLLGQDIYISRQRVHDSLLELTLMVYC